jgi:hypothetical protein
VWVGCVTDPEVCSPIFYFYFACQHLLHLKPHCLCQYLLHGAVGCWSHEQEEVFYRCRAGVHLFVVQFNICFHCLQALCTSGRMNSNQ